MPDNLKDAGYVKCNFCGSNDFIFLFNGYDYLFPSDEPFKISRCDKCGLVCLNPRPRNITSYYLQEEYKKPTKKDIFAFLEPNRAKIIEGFKTKGRILDIGIGRGEFLFEMKKRGWQVFGNELSDNLYTFAKNEYNLENIYNKDLLDIDFPDKLFDVITLWHVLEHLIDPLKSLKKINKILKEDGLIIIESPNFESLQRKFFKDKWYALGVPRHLYQFSPKILAKVLEESGLKIIRKDYFVNSRIDFVTLKVSLLNSLRLRRLTVSKNGFGVLISGGIKKYRIIFKLLRILLELGCFVFSLFLSLINCGSCFRIYCKKIHEQSQRKHTYN
jgi:2-polyprenyl-3-methyl-5-hydroxy-6-metoxy-1,4-benzoquinol methylase